METVIKKWGKELIIHNDFYYCQKILFINKDAKFSMHFHAIKKETWYVYKGRLIYTYIDTKNANKEIKELKVGDVVEIDRYLPHQLEALEDSEVFETSTQHFDNDSYRIGKGDNQITNEEKEAELHRLNRMYNL